ncbi:kinase-like domain-containing protein [Xylaria intraflava]|nr:kinase-like domain-containing protein [Xylaria intraflava]
MAQPLPPAIDFAGDEDEDAQTIATTIKECFTRSNIWECEKILGNGAYGVAILVKERNAKDGYRRRVMLKRALTAGVDELKVEIETLKLLRGSAHVATILASCTDLTDAMGKEIPNTDFRSIFKTLNGLGGPAFVQEYCPNGTLESLRQRAIARNIEVPNRLLWRVYLCLVRACIALAYPPGNAVDAASAMENIRAGNVPGDLVHGDIAGRNIVIGDSDPEVSEHSYIPMLKMIDFGSSRNSYPGKGPEENLHAVAVEMLRLICKGRVRTGPRFATTFGDVRTGATDILPVNGVPRFPNLDNNLRDLLVQALRIDRENRPTLDEMLDLVRTRGNQMTPDIIDLDHDFDEPIIQRLIYDV